jgi:hypothetical protein
MKIATADNLLIATLWQRVLESAGIRCEIRNRFACGAAGELPIDASMPQLWLIDDRDAVSARTVLRELHQPPQAPPWQCTRCSEPNEVQFFQCWRCQQSRA